MSRTRRVAVASPQTRLAMARRSGVRAQAPHLARADLERARRIHRAQLRTALGALALLTGVVVGLPLLLAAVPELSDVHVFGIRVSWLAVGVLPYAALVAIAVVQLHRAERIEAPPAPPPRPQQGTPAPTRPQQGTPAPITDPARHPCAQLQQGTLAPVQLQQGSPAAVPGVEPSP